MSDSPSNTLDIKQSFVHKRRFYFAEVQKFLEKHSDGYDAKQTADMAADLNRLLDMHTEIANAPLLYTLETAAQLGFSISGQLSGGPGLDVEVSEKDLES